MTAIRESWFRWAMGKQWQQRETGCVNRSRANLKDKIPGEHVGIFSESNVVVLADLLGARLNDGRPRDRNTQKAVV